MGVAWWIAMTAVVIGPWILAAPASVRRAGLIGLNTAVLAIPGALVAGLLRADSWSYVAMAGLVSGLLLVGAAEWSSRWHERQRAES